MMILRKQILVYRWKKNGFFIIKNIRKRIYIKRFHEFAFIVVSFNLQNFVVFPIDSMAKLNRVLRESCCVYVAVFHVPHMFLFAHFKPAFSFANLTHSLTEGR